MTNCSSRAISSRVNPATIAQNHSSVYNTKKLYLTFCLRDPYEFKLVSGLLFFSPPPSPLVWIIHIILFSNCIKLDKILASILTKMSSPLSQLYPTAHTCETLQRLVGWGKPILLLCLGNESVRPCRLTTLAMVTSITLPLLREAKPSKAQGCCVQG